MSCYRWSVSTVIINTLNKTVSRKHRLIVLWGKQVENSVIGVDQGKEGTFIFFQFF